MRKLFLIILLTICCTCKAQLANSLIKEETPIVKDSQNIDTIQVIAESDSIFVKGKFFYEKKDFSTAITYFLKSDSVIHVHFGTNSPYLGYGKIWASSCYHKLGMDSIALRYSNYYDKQPIDKMLTHTSDSVVWVALKLIELGQIKNAAEKLLEAAKLEEQELGLNNYWYANTLSNCAGLYCDLGYFEKAIELGKEAAEIYKVSFGKEHLNYATCLSNLAIFYSYIGNSYLAIQLGKEAIDVKKRILGSEYPSCADDLSNLAESYYTIGNYSEALKLGTEAMHLRKTIFGINHSDYALSLCCLANYHFETGNYSEALRLGTEAMEIFRKVWGPAHPYYATSLFRLATYYSGLGNFTKALQLGIEAMEINKKVLGVKHTQYVTCICNIAIYYANLGKYAEAIQFGKEYVELTKTIFGAEHSEHANSLANLASYYSSIGNYDEAKRLVNRAMDILEKINESEHLRYSICLNNLAVYNTYLGNYFEALSLSKKAIDLRKNFFGTENLNNVSFIITLLSIYLHIENYADAYAFLRQYLYSSQPYILRNLVELSSNLRESLWTRKFANIFSCLLPYIVEKHKNKESISELYDMTCLFAKGLLLNTDMKMRSLIFESCDSVIIDKYNALVTNISIYNKLLGKSINERFMNADSLSNIIEQQEMILARDSKAYGNYTHNLTISWKDVQNGLGDGDIAIEFLDFPIYNSDSTVYVALTLKKGYDSPHMVMLFEEKQLNAIAEDIYYSQTDVSDLVWKPLEEELRGIRNVYFAPSGELHRIGIEYLPISKTENISDVYTLHRLSSTRQLAVVQYETKGKNNIIYGGINYDEKSRIVSRDSASTKGSVLRTAFSRANVDSLSLRNSFEYLEGSKKEADMIAEDMKMHHVPYIYYSGTDGSEESFKLLNGTKPKTMHIATHGFYFSKSEAEKTIFARPDMEMMTEGIQKISHPVEDKPMTRSGLLFSGCNRAFRHEQIPDCEEDGILTAQEISRLDLRGLDLVVLSACQTGLGDLISGEGVFGLQRGFKKAGAKTILMSLNKVDDEATQILMVEFYKNLMNGKSKHQSLKDSQKYLRQVENGKYDKPEYWASFILLDGIL